MPAGRTIDPNPEHGADAYCRAARRIRHVHARQPARLYRELRALSARQGAWHAASAAHAALSGGRCEAFAAEVAERMDGPILRQAQRRALMEIAHRAGIGRFEANLVIAAVQHRGARLQPVGGSEEAVAGGRHLGPLALVVAVQALVALGTWQLLWG